MFYLSHRYHFSKSSKTIQIFTAGGTVGLAYWITDNFCLFSLPLHKAMKSYKIIFTRQICQWLKNVKLD